MYDSEIGWPLDYTVNDCNDPALLPANLPPAYGYPTYPNKPCSEIGVNYQDKVYTNYNGTCKTIFRTWTLIDPCSYYEYVHVQKLYINDSVKPEFVECSDKVISVEALPNCEYYLDYVKEATDNCTTTQELHYSYDIDLFNNGFIEIWEPGNHITMNIPAGEHEIFWKVEDDCGNFSVCTEIITVLDSKEPTPYCLGGISTVVMETTGSIEIWASDFNLNSEDNCTSQADLRYSFSPNVNNTSMLFTCDDLDGADEKFYDLEIYVFDEAGNYDLCTSTIRITSNGHCDGSGTVSFDLGGIVKSEVEEPMSDVELTLKNMDNNESFSLNTDEFGYYAFPALTSMLPYEVSAKYNNDDYLNGVTTLDIILIQKHILGIQALDSPYKLIAADVNDSESITGSDLIQIRKLILGFYDEFPATDSWRFVDSHAEYSDPNHPWPIQDKIIANPLMDDMMDRDLVSVKIGDVNNTHTMDFWSESIDTRDEDELFIYYAFAKKSDQSSVRFYTKENVTIEGMQMAMNSSLFDKKTKITSNQLLVTENNYRINSNRNEVSFSWSAAQATEVQGDLFEMDVNGTEYEKIILQLNGVAAEAYVLENDVLVTKSIQLRKEGEGTIESQKEQSIYLWQNEPNPFTYETTIRFSTPIDDVLEFQIRSLNGTLLYQQSTHYKAGEHQIKVEQEDLNYSGLMIYTISGSTGSRSGKMMSIR